MASELILPRGYLSYSAMILWQRSKDQYRKQYYEGVRSPVTTEMHYGTKIGKLLEDHPDDKLIAHIPKYMHPECVFHVKIEGVPVYGKIDSFDPVGRAIIEYKTSVKPWTKLMVAKHTQLDFYCAAMGAKECDLVWLETKRVQKEMMGMFSQDYEVELTGRFEVIHRTITDSDIAHIKGAIVKAANEISTDYQNYLNQI